MSGWFDRLRTLLAAVFKWRQPPRIPTATLTPPVAAPSIIADPVPPVAAPTTEPIDQEPQPNRAERRSLDRQKRHFERQRRKFDKFVKPQGPIPAKITKAAPQPRTTPTPQDQPERGTFTDDGDEFICVDVHHSDRKTKVLYESSEFYGEFNFRDTILEQIERYMVYIDRMKKRDAGAYEFYKRVGATLVPYSTIPDTWTPKIAEIGKENREQNKTLTPWFKATRPAFGCIAYGTNPEAERRELEDRDAKYPNMRIWIPKFLYFTKYTHPPPEFQPMAGGDVYMMTVYWDRPQDPKMAKKLKGSGIPQCYGIFVSTDSDEVIVLRQLETKKFKIRSKKYGTGYIPQRLWCIPHDYEEWAKEHNTDAQTFLSGLFIDSATRLETSAWSLVRVTVSKDSRRVTFGVDVRRTPYFFQDRDIELTEHGHKKPIFHMVRPHERQGKAVGFQFRGQREFTWAGYDVRITVPGRDHVMLEEVPIGSIDSYWKQSGIKYLDEKQFGDRMAKIVDEGIGGIHP